MQSTIIIHSNRILHAKKLNNFYTDEHSIAHFVFCEDYSKIESRY